MDALQARALTEKYRNIEENPEAKKVYEDIMSSIKVACTKGLFTTSITKIPCEPMASIIKLRLEKDGFTVKHNAPYDQRDSAYWTVSW